MVATALDYARPGEPNASFRRPDATLMVVFISNGDDASEPYFSDEPVAEFLERLSEEESS